MENSLAFVYFVIFDLLRSRAKKKTEPTASHDQVKQTSIRLRHTNVVIHGFETVVVASFGWKTYGRLCISLYLTFLDRGQKQN